MKIFIVCILVLTEQQMVEDSKANSTTQSTTVTTETRAYCPTCDAEREIRKTVPWQADLCTVCGSDID